MYPKQLILSLALAGSVLMTACDKDDDTETPVNPDEEYVLPNNGTIDQLLFDSRNNVKLTAGQTFLLKGGVQLEEGQILTIEEGVTVKSDPNEQTTAYLLIGPGAQIMAEGTATQPIVFTSGQATPKFQDWGGIILCGRAPVNSPTGVFPSEMGVGVEYGGTNVNDNSGILRYVRVEYTGKKQSDTKEHNGFTFEGVGKGTVTEYLCSYEGGDDGFEWFGGTVDAKYLVSVGAKDDLFDWTFGWTGRGQHWVGIQADDVADRGIEADNNEDNHTATPYSSPIISNMVLVGSTAAVTGDDPTNPANPAGQTRVMELRRGTKGHIYNMVAYGFNQPIRINNDQSLANANDGSLAIKNSYVHFAAGRTWAFTPNTGAYTGENPFVAPAYMNFHTNTQNGAPAGITAEFKGKLQESDAVDPKTIDAWFNNAKYKGAVDPANDWTAGNWVRL